MYTADWDVDKTSFFTRVTNKESSVETSWTSCSFLFFYNCPNAQKETSLHYVVAASRTLCKSQSLCSVCTNYLSGLLTWKLLFFLSFSITNCLSSDVVLSGNTVLIGKSVLLFPQRESAHCFFLLSVWKYETRGVLISPYPDIILNAVGRNR